MFTVRLGSTVLLAKLGLTGGFFFSAASRVIRGVMGAMIELGVMAIDLTLDTIKEGTKLKGFEKEAQELYDLTTRQVYDEAEKIKIRKRYLEIIMRIGPVGGGPK